MVEPHSSNYNKFFGCPNIEEIYGMSLRHNIAEIDPVMKCSFTVLMGILSIKIINDTFYILLQMVSKDSRNFLRLFFWTL